MMSIVSKVFGFLTGNIAQYFLIGGAVLSVYAYHNYSIKDAAYKEGQKDVVIETIKVQEKAVKQARKVRNRVRSKPNNKRVRREADKYFRD